MTYKRRPYPLKHRKKLALQAKKRKPWKRSTGPKTKTGKARASQNAFLHGLYGRDFTNIQGVLLAQKAFVKSAMTWLDQNR